jgi:hypothetical protein
MRSPPAPPAAPAPRHEARNRSPRFSSRWPRGACASTARYPEKYQCWRTCAERSSWTQATAWRSPCACLSSGCRQTLEQRPSRPPPQARVYVASPEYFARAAHLPPPPARRPAARVWHPRQPLPPGGCRPPRPPTRPPSSPTPAAPSPRPAPHPAHAPPSRFSPRDPSGHPTSSRSLSTHPLPPPLPTQSPTLRCPPPAPPPAPPSPAT